MPPRIRTIKPDLWDSEKIGKTSLLARLSFVGLISIADDEGRGRADPIWLGGRLHGYDPKARAGLPAALEEIASTRTVGFYEANGGRYYQIKNWPEHQRIDRPTPSVLPPPPADLFGEGSASTRRGFGEPSLPDRKGREGNGEEILSLNERPPVKEVPPPPVPSRAQRRPRVKTRREPNLAEHPELRPTPEQVDAKIAEKFPEFAGLISGETFVAHYDEVGWIKPNGLPIVRWVATLYNNWVVPRAEGRR